MARPKNVYGFGGGHWGFWYCGIDQFFMRYFDILDHELRYCGILQTHGMRILCILVDEDRCKNLFFTVFCLYSGFGSLQKQTETVFFYT